jgi:hypothetical protein
MDTHRTWLKATALATILGISLGIPAPADASIVDPAILFTGGNPITCTQPFGNTAGLGYDSGVDVSGAPVAASYNITVNGAVVGSVTVTPSAGGLDWTSTYPISAVIMKGGAAANLYPYVLPPNSAGFPGVDWAGRIPVPGYPGSQTADTDLNFPQGASHFEFCYQDDEQIIPPPPEISKTATPSWIQHHDWTLTKTADPTSITMFNGDSHDAGYTLHATKDAWGNFTVSGEITITDPSHTYIVDSVADSIIFSDDPSSTPIPVTPSCAAVDDGSDVIYHCTYSLTLSSKTPGYEYLAGGGGGVNSATAVVHYPGLPIFDIGPTTANFTFAATPDASYGDSLVVDDTHDEGDHTFTDAGDFNYTLTFSCPDDEGDNGNTATGTWSADADNNNSVSDDANVAVTCEDVTVVKTADTSFDEDFSWTGDKKIVVRPEDLTKEEKSTYCSLISDASDPYVGNYVCDDITIILNEGGIYDTVYQLNAARSAANESGFKVFGDITVSWPSGLTPVFSGDPTDVLHFSDAAAPLTQDAVVTCDPMGATSLVCHYSADLASKRDGVNWASIDRPHVCYDAAGAVIACATPGSENYTDDANFAFGDATTSTDECVSLSDLFNDGGLNLGPTFSWTVDGNVCDSTTRYVTGDVDPTAAVKSLAIHADWAPTGFEDNACVFPVPNVLTLVTNDTQTSGSDGALISVNVPSVCNHGCTLTQGYWKTHSKYGPAPYDSTWAVIGEDTLFFHSGKTWITLFKTPPKGGNAYIQLAHQYMAARLNVEAGASTPANVATALATATAMFNAAGSSFTSAQTTKARQLAGIIGSYNEGALGPGHCSESPVRTLVVKALK